MNDKELLELAAKAAGYTLEDHHDINGEYWPWCIEEGEYWCPLTDDGDALRLAVKLKLSIRFWSNGDVVVGPDDDIYECMAGDEAEAVRCTIVRAAAEIGRSMG